MPEFMKRLCDKISNRKDVKRILVATVLSTFMLVECCLFCLCLAVMYGTIELCFLLFILLVITVFLSMWLMRGLKVRIGWLQKDDNRELL